MKLSTALVFIAVALTATSSSLVTPAEAIFAKPTLLKAGGGGGKKGTHKLGGSYCGSYMANMVSGKVTMNTDETFDLTIKAFSNPEVGCKNIKFSYDEKTGKVVVPDAAKPSSCLGDLLNSGGLSLEVSFDSSKGSVKLDLGIAKLNLANC